MNQPYIFKISLEAQVSFPTTFENYKDPIDWVTDEDIPENYLMPGERTVYKHIAKLGDNASKVFILGMLLSELRDEIEYMDGELYSNGMDYLLEAMYDAADPKVFEDMVMCELTSHLAGFGESYFSLLNNIKIATDCNAKLNGEDVDIRKIAKDLDLNAKKIHEYDWDRGYILSTVSKRKDGHTLFLNTKKYSVASLYNVISNFIKKYKISKIIYLILEDDKLIAGGWKESIEALHRQKFSNISHEINIWSES